MSTVNAGWRGPNIVRDGLVMYLDAGSGTSYSSYISATTWKSMTLSNVSSSLINGPTFSVSGSGSFSFDGVDDYALTNTTFNSSQGTWGIWFNPDTLSLAAGYGRRLLHQSDGSGNNEINIIHSNGNVSWYGYGASSYSWNISGSGVTTGSWFNAVGTYDESNAYLYLNGNLIASSSRSVSVGNATVNLYIARVGFVNQGLYSGKISPVQIYNRTLTSTEVLQNYNATRARFGR